LEENRRNKKGQFCRLKKIKSKPLWHEYNVSRKAVKSNFNMVFELTISISRVKGFVMGTDEAKQRLKECPSPPQSFCNINAVSSVFVTLFTSILLLFVTILQERFQRFI